MKRWPFGARRTVVGAFVALAGLLGTVALVASNASGLDVPTQIVPVNRTLREARRRSGGSRRVSADRRGASWPVTDDSGQSSIRTRTDLQESSPGVSDRKQQREVFVGTSMLAVLNTPKPSSVASWPLVDYPDGKRQAYRIRTMELTVRGLRSMSVLVDLKRRKVAGFSPWAATKSSSRPATSLLRQAGNRSPDADRDYLYPTTMEVGPTSGLTSDSRKPASAIQRRQSAPV